MGEQIFMAVILVPLGWQILRFWYGVVTFVMATGKKFQVIHSSMTSQEKGRPTDAAIHTEK